MVESELTGHLSEIDLALQGSYRSDLIPRQDRSNAAPRVFKVRHRLKMVRVDAPTMGARLAARARVAGTSVADMVELHPRRYRAIFGLVVDCMDKAVSALSGDDCVPILRYYSLPQPAPIRKDLPLRVECDARRLVVRKKGLRLTSDPSGSPIRSGHDSSRLSAATQAQPIGPWHIRGWSVMAVHNEAEL